MSLLLDGLAGLLTGILSGFGIGGGTLLVLYMTGPGGLEQHLAQGINLLYFLPCASGALISHIKNKKVDFSAALPAILCGLPAAGLGAWAAFALDGGILRRVFGGLMTVIGLFELFSRKKSDIMSAAG